MHIVAEGYCTTLKATFYETERRRKPNPTLTAVYDHIRIVTPEAELKYAIPLDTWQSVDWTQIWKSSDSELWCTEYANEAQAR